jgi:hypothetical protein
LLPEGRPGGGSKMRDRDDFGRAFERVAVYVAGIVIGSVLGLTYGGIAGAAFAGFRGFLMAGILGGLLAGGSAWWLIRRAFNH